MNLNRFQRLTSKKVHWIDIINPNRVNIEFLRTKYNLPAPALEELMRPSARQKVDMGKNYMYLVLHLPIYQPERLTSQALEVDFILTKRALISVRYEQFEPIDKFFISCSADPKLAHKCLGKTPIELFFYLGEDIFDYLLRELTHVNEKINALEEIIFQEKTKTLVKDLLYIKRDILVFRRLTREIQPILESLKREIGEFFPGEYTSRLNALLGQYLRVLHVVEDYKDSIESLENTHSSVVDISMSTVMKEIGRAHV